MTPGEFWQHHRKAFGIALLVLYAPQLFSGLRIVGNSPFDFLCTPGMFYTTYANQLYSFLFKDDFSPLMCHLGDAVFTIALIVILTLIGARNRRWQLFAIVAGGICSIFAALSTYVWYGQGAL